MPRKPYYRFFMPIWAFPAVLLSFILLGGGPIAFMVFIMPLFIIASVCSFVPFWRKTITITQWIFFGAIVPTLIGFCVGLIALAIQALTIGVKTR